MISNTKYSAFPNVLAPRVSKSFGANVKNVDFSKTTGRTLLKICGTGAVWYEKLSQKIWATPII